MLQKVREKPASSRKTQKTLEPMPDITPRLTPSQKHGNEAKSGGIPLFRVWSDQIGHISDALRHPAEQKGGLKAAKSIAFVYAAFAAC